MDSLRAAMMLLGIVFHAAWFFMPVWFGHTLSEPEGSWGYMYFFFWVHQFRMQTFFLIAGFFSCLLLNRRGARSFIRNRLLRVALPFVVAMLTLFPLMKLQDIRGGNLSGRIVSDDSIWSQFSTTMTGLRWQIEWPVHLWFLETLLLLYGISLVFYVVFHYLIDRNGSIRGRLTEWVLSLSASHWGAFVLAIPVMACLIVELDYFGIDSGPLKPLWRGVIAYWVFFAVGWCMYRRPEVIDRYLSRWPAYLLVGTLISFALCFQFIGLLDSGRISWFYPAISPEEVDYEMLRERLLDVSESQSSDQPHSVLWEQLSQPYQRFIRQNAEVDSDQMTGIANELAGATVFNPEFSSQVGETTSGDPIEQRKLLNRLFPEWISPRYIPSWSWRCVYFYGYGFATWLLIFGMLGLFRRFLSNPSHRLRYLSDSSYWLYLIHLPLQYELSLYLNGLNLNGFIKFLIYNVISFAILIPSYHYLVRSTWLGLWLNGRRYPIK